MSKASAEYRKLKGYEQHGVSSLEVKALEAVGVCPFCKIPKRFSINVESFLWRCFHCSIAGNFDAFLKLVSNQYTKALTKETARPLSKDRGIKLSTLRAWGVGWSKHGQFYSIPQGSSSPGSTTDIIRYAIGKKPISTTGGKIGLIRPIELSESECIWLCEGKWDGMTLWECLRECDKDNLVYAVPGAGNLSRKVLDVFYDKDVIVVFDNDEAGRKGGLLAYGKLEGIAKTIKFINWPSGLPDGFDIRDYFIAHSSDHQKTYRDLVKLVTTKRPLVQVMELADPGDKPLRTIEPSGQGMEVSEVEQVYTSWLSMRNTDCLDIMFGSAFANRIPGDPLWMLLVAPPGGMKSELLMSLSTAPKIVTTSTLTPQALTSGMNFGSGEDPSLIPKLNNKVLIIKDLTTILEMHPNQRDEIFGILRDAYDGEFTKLFGNLVKRRYKSLFGIVAGVTPKIEAFGRANATVGERFLKYQLRPGGKQIDSRDAIRQALHNIKENDRMRKELSEVGYAVLNRAIAEDEYPDISDAMMEKLIGLAQWVAMLRGVVDRERYTGRINYKPMTEVGTRLAKQLCKLAYGISIYRDQEMVSKRTYRIITQVAQDTAPDRVEEIVRRLYTNRPLEARAVDEVSAMSGFPQDTTRFLLQDLTLLKITMKEPGRIGRYRLTDDMVILMDDIGLYRKPKRKKKIKRRKKNGKI